MAQLFVHTLNMSITGIYVILFVIVARMLFRKVPKIYSYALWSVVWFRLVCPISFESVFSLIPAQAQSVPLNMIYPQTPQMQSEITGLEDQAVNQMMPASAPLTSPVANLSSTPTNIWFEIGQYLWLFGIALLIAYSMVTTIRLHRKLKNASPVYENVYEKSGITTPFVFGVLRPKIYLPVGLHDQERAYIIKHEQVHIKRLDHIIKPFAFAVLCIHWFNPFAWVAFFLMSDDMEKSCDESVIRQLGSGIKKDYSTSLLSLSTGKRYIGGSPLAFGKSNTKGRIINILHYKKPAFWVVIVAVIAVAALCVGLISNPRKADLTVKDYAEQYVDQRITDFKNVKIVDRKITKFERIAEFDKLLSTPLEIWALEYRLKPDDPNKLILAEGMTDGLITEEGSMGKPMLIFSYENSSPQYLGVIRSGENDMTTKSGQEMALRVFLEGNGQLPHETYRGNHILVKFPLSTGETSQLLLSQPVVQGDSGIWCVERWKDTNGNEYYNTPQTEIAIADYYARLQTQAAQGEAATLLEPLQVALQYINKDLGQHVSSDELVADDDASAKDFAITPESTLLGYVQNLSMDHDSFDFDKVEWLTLKDSARFKNLNINPDVDMPGGFYILNKDTYTDPLKVTGETKYLLLDPESGETNHTKIVSKQTFIEHFEQYPESGALCTITSKDGYVTSIAEKYLP
ncbi:M56 family metallopeptidase [Paenibacillus dokdonensis]|uniref:M56 family metallopeptidase n=1 Tax=Paenibacillus dokdonensis TaxID=2567944 RepID=A0ABU6GRF7_9BACL|nr:M56 family metallopeptidase [Paenibacillus dokdonensis]MEC0242356.1 M56 family metallopeptidase [Paenibacillus dokdonensis]